MFLFYLKFVSGRWTLSQIIFPFRWVNDTSNYDLMIKFRLGNTHLVSPPSLQLLKLFCKLKTFPQNFLCFVALFLSCHIYTRILSDGCCCHFSLNLKFCIFNNNNNNTFFYDIIIIVAAAVVLSEHSCYDDSGGLQLLASDNARVAMTTCFFWSQRQSWHLSHYQKKKGEEGLLLILYIFYFEF